MSDTDGLAAETRRLLDAATELTAEWYIERTYNKRVPDHWSVDVLSDDDHVCSVRGGDEGAHALAALIAAAPRLLANWLAREDRLADATVLDVLADWWFAADYCNQPEPFKVRVSESIVDALQEGGYEVVPIAERDRLADENRALREAARAVAFCDSCGEPTHEPNEDCWFMDRSSCAYALNPNGGGTCSFDCRDEPSCMTDGPYPMERLRLVLAAADRGVTDGEATTSRRPVQFDAYASNPWPDGEATDG